jgi:hypothetical protein
MVVKKLGYPLNYNYIINNTYILNGKSTSIIYILTHPTDFPEILNSIP